MNNNEALQQKYCRMLTDLEIVAWAGLTAQIDLGQAPWKFTMVSPLFVNFQYFKS